ncbi:undecaprenyldiphospho-muramoylpentapeptide beta-N-acetylglucosaminyltransferase [Candidatus Desantisbacteria bacterium CG2_30_40_21]|uniref:UDP-N-acetylglucosamine--N-acetylmuramyl-(pentapeptide) pyrophosphoryl-undecaprenol N-acetylglucosamine transferase n=2 Tax=unclassified Candidatus Desantisiibacteriota TaxID=3106372 RepID=A0A2M7J8V2_9BACT|nr:MAG: undecaprenyldiphospho-muramoylpentapeptide beta-N-acetylglucosaminyltransferase [Candidatus Desantisbacteria bacterium CG2_30_40_21]PIX15791.1 MAG: undecaprenyldiphospho-muramoylpentapeptide beta-N-acetylglucosaminyltransferase [Candidatus Desantisbacteria bacterium CG_4_8_14_3_um_filter_40_12]
MRIVITGGGTGGHLYPGVSIAYGLRERQIEVLFVGNINGIEAKVVPQEGFEFKGIDICGWNRTLPGIFRVAWKLLGAFWTSCKYLLKFKPDAILGTGGYVCVPVILAGRALGIRCVLHEQNAIPGLAVRMLSKIVDKIAVSMPESSKYLPREKVVVTGNPVRKGIGQVEKQQAIKRFGLSSKQITVLVFGGSKGAKSINMAVMQALIKGIFKKLQLIWITGQDDYPCVKNIQAYTTNCRIFEYLNDMDYAYGAADLVVCRSGATTVAEVIACRVPAIMVPYPYATDNHQEKNARVLEQCGAARVVLDAELPHGRLAEVMVELLYDVKKLDRMRQGYKGFDMDPYGAVDRVMKIVSSR